MEVKYTLLAKPLFIIFFLLVFQSTTHAQFDWGIGLIAPPDSLLCGGGCPAMENARTVPLYVSKEGTKIQDSLKLDGFNYNMVSDEDYKPPLEVMRLECETAASGKYIIFYEETATVVQVQFYSEPAGELIKMWIRKADFEAAGFNVKRYVSFFATYKLPWYNKLLTYYTNTGLNLRAGPDTSYSTIVKMPPLKKEPGISVFAIQPLGSVEGNWIKVNVTHYDQSECTELMPEQVVLKTYVGWIKVVDDKTGAPNIWIDNCCEFD